MPERADHLSLIGALRARGAPMDGVGHQAHVDVARPVQRLEDSSGAVEALDPSLLPAVTERGRRRPTEIHGADVSGGTLAPCTPAFADPADAGAEVGYYRRDLFAMLRQQAAAIDSVYALPSTIDTVDGVVPVTCTLAPGTRFAVGTTTVSCTATDAARNTRTTTFDVVVARRQAVTQ